jgi:hypothetical protein
VEGVRFAEWFDVSDGIPEIGSGSGKVLHGLCCTIVGHKQRLRRIVDGKEEIRAVAEPRCAVFEILSVEAGGDRVSQAGRIRLGQRNELRSTHFVDSLGS